MILSLAQLLALLLGPLFVGTMLLFTLARIEPWLERTESRPSGADSAPAVIPASAKAQAPGETPEQAPVSAETRETPAAAAVTPTLPGPPTSPPPPEAPVVDRDPATRPLPESSPRPASSPQEAEPRHEPVGRRRPRHRAPARHAMRNNRGHRLVGGTADQD